MKAGRLDQHGEKRKRTGDGARTIITRAVVGQAMAQDRAGQGGGGGIDLGRMAGEAKGRGRAEKIGCPQCLVLAENPSARRVANSQKFLNRVVGSLKLPV